MGRLDGRIAAVTGAGRGIGAEIAKLMAREGAQVVVNDLGGNTDGTGTGKIADEVVAEIRKAGGEAVANTQSIADVKGGESLLATAVDAFGGLDILVNNAGILRDKTIFNMEESDWDAVMAVHLKGHYCCSRPFAKYIRDQNRTNCRIVNFSSVSGLFGNFGQANYGAAKMALVGLMQTLSIEGAKNDIRVNCLAPTAATRMTQDLLPPAVLEALRPEAVVPAMLVLAAEDAPTRTILCAGAGSVEAAHVTLTRGQWIGLGDDAPEKLAARLAEVTDREGSTVPESGAAQGQIEIGAAMAHAGRG